ncbi:orotidine 5'-phosphate decarboxylase [Halobacillus salinarum]|uniref:3-hexulose-6-phosphate synthase n=1 Tax=Halobacillus salinarum TaxID=2932257 RepID=A0ABY4EMU8_9BACI|nr:3-hexulose-6-phosphate synthase [Halobacillus salinarum]UOQ44984.1 orotidine 5'-phosphate decarboxylase [Halobacillus salinarum]
MNIQLALDRLTIEEAVSIAGEVEGDVDWIEVGTSLIKEFGMDSVKRMKARFPNKTILADMKTIDNAKYEAELCFEAGADVMTVMGAASPATIEACLETAGKYKREVMIDLLHLSDSQKEKLLPFETAIFCEHVSKDEQEMGGQKNELARSMFQGLRMAVAGGITEASFNKLQMLRPEVVIIGSAITKAADRKAAASRLKQLSKQEEVK